MLIKNGYLINPATNTEENTDIRVENGIITEMGTLTAAPEEEVLDITGIQKLATLPNREGLLSMLLSALTGNLSGLARALDAVKTKMEGEGEVA